MSFTATPLGSQNNRRVDHNTFFNKSQPPPERGIPTSYSYSGAPLTRSPPKVTQSLQDEPALVRFAKQKQKASAEPQRWSVKDTSVQIANAFHQAATGDAMSNPNDSWASGTSRKANIPRSTSVEYEKETQSTTVRRLNPPPVNRVPARRTVAKTTSIQHVPDSEDEAPAYVRGKSPFEHVADAARSVLKPASYFLIRKSKEPEDLNGKDGSSYDYEEEEQQFQEQRPSQPLAKQRSANKRGRISVDNKAYRPSASDLELSEDDFEDGRKVRKKKRGKKDAVGGPLTSLPVAGYDKRRRRKKNTKAGENGADGEEEEDDDDEDESETDEQEKVSEHRSTAGQRTSVSRTSQPLRTSAPRDSVPPEYEPNPDTSMDVEQGLNSIPELEEPLDTDYDEPPLSKPPAAFSIGGFLGRIVNWIIRSFVLLFTSLFRLLSYLTWYFGQLLGVAIKTPKEILDSINLANLAKLALVIAGAWFVWNQTQGASLPTLSWSKSPRAPYQPPSVPAADMSELSVRLQALEGALSSLSMDSERARIRLENELNKGNSDLVGRLGSLETKVQRESARVLEAESQFRQSASQGMKSVKQEIEALQSQVAIVPTKGDAEGADENRIKLKLLEERVGSVEGGMKEALELGKNTVKVGTSAGAAAWWNKLATAKSGSSLTIKSTDGQDVTSLIKMLVDSAVGRYLKDVLARPDFALNSGGATVIPSLTSPTYEIRPEGTLNSVIGFITGSGYAVGRPPVTALHHEISNGHCWPFSGTRGHLGVKLSWPAKIADITIDHAATEVAFDMRSAPRDMELWGLVEGKDNLGKFKTYLAEKQARREESIAAGEPIRPEDEEWVLPVELPRGLYYARIASFSYDINALVNIQTYPAAQDIQDLDIDFGLVILFVNNNWGRDEFTCLYRMRVHGEQVGDIPAPWSPQEAVDAS